MLFTACWVQAQEADRVILQDKTTYTGKVVEQKPGEYIRLALTGSSDTLTLQMDEIDRLVKVPADNASGEASGDSNIEFNNNKFYLNLGSSTGGGDVAFKGLGIGLGYRIQPGFSIGLYAEYIGSVGFALPEPYDFQKLPLILETRYELQEHFDGRGAIYGYLGAGYSITLDDEYREPDLGRFREVTDGFAFKPGLGYRINIFENTGLLLDVNYLLIIDETRNENKLRIKTNKWSNFMISAKLFF